MSRGVWTGIFAAGILVLVAFYSLSGKPAPPPPAEVPDETSLAKVLKATKEPPPPSGTIIPGAGRVTIEPRFPFSTEALTARFEPFPGANNFPRFQWFLEGRAIQGATETSLQPAQFRRDSYIFVRVTVDTPAGPSVIESQPVRIRNSPPTIQEAPASIPVQPDGMVRFQVQASDPDQEPLTFSVESSLPSVKIDPKTGRIEGKIPPGSSSFTSKVIVKDPDGLSASREITFRLPAPFQPESGQAPPPGKAGGG